MKFKKSIIFTVVTFGYIEGNKIRKGVKEFPGKKPLERVRAGIKSEVGGVLIEPKISYIQKVFEFDLKDGKEIKNTNKNKNGGNNNVSYYY